MCFLIGFVYVEVCVYVIESVVDDVGVVNFGVIVG